MTNFEKWKAGLTVEQVAEWIKGDIQGLYVMTCDVCPLNPYCHVDAGEDCKEALTEWAKKECEDD